MKEKIMQLLAEQEMTIQTLSQLLVQDDAKSFKKLVKTVAELEQQKQIQITQKGSLKLVAQDVEYVEGWYKAHEKGFGFVRVENRSEDIYIPKGQQVALSGDFVRVRITKESDLLTSKVSEGVIETILERAMTSIVGEFVKYSQRLIEKTGYYGYLIPKSKAMSEYTCFIEYQKGLQVVDGTICVAEITSYPTPDSPKNLNGILVKEIGYKDEPGVDILSVLHKHNIPIEFPERVLDTLKSLPLTILPDDTQERLDLRQEKIVTIDGDDAKDLDDAISVKRLDDGLFQLGVHIADVSHYVQENSPLDNEAYLRGTSVYLTDRVVPMLPQILSNGICSLHPDEDRLTLSCIMTINSAGQVVAYHITPSVICSNKRMTYDRVNAAIVEGNKNAQEEYTEYLDMLELMKEVHTLLYHKRVKRGAIDFDTNEAKIYVDDNGAPLDIVLRERGLAERMIESFMLCANETIAEHFMQKQFPFLYRVHEQPAEDKMQRFLEFATNFGIMVKGTSATITSKSLQKVLNHVEDQPYEVVVSTMLLRSMKQARYDEQPLGHFGLATKYYTHFTSPIRRYPDLIVHRLIKKYVEQPPKKADYDKLISQLEDIAQQSSVTERRAVEAERETEAIKKAEYMADKVGHKFTGVISSVTRFGIFVELPNTVEGLIHVSKMSDDHYDFIDNHLLLVGKRTGKTYQIGQEVQIKVARVDTESHDIDFELIYTKSDKMQAKLSAKKRKAKKKTKHKLKKRIVNKKKRR